MHGELPSESDKNEFEEIIKNHTLLNEQIIQNFPSYKLTTYHTITIIHKYYPDYYHIYII